MAYHASLRWNQLKAPREGVTTWLHPLCFDDKSDDNAANLSRTKTSTSPGWKTNTTGNKLTGKSNVPGPALVSKVRNRSVMRGNQAFCTSECFLRQM